MSSFSLLSFPSAVIPANSAGGGNRRDDAAFEELVKTWSRLVFSTALHRLEGDAAGAQEITQNVFLTAFRKYETLAKADTPAAWFHRAAMLESSNFLRAERCRRRHLEAFAKAESIAPSGPPEPVPEPLRVHLDEVLNGLRDQDRELVLSRFFEGRSFQEIAGRRRSTPDAVRVKLNRLLEKLAALLKRRGVAVTAVSLGAALTTQWTHAAPAALTASISAATAATAVVSAAGAGKTAIFLTLMSSGKTIGLTVLAILIALFSLHSQSGRIDDLKTRLAHRHDAAAARLSAGTAKAAADAKGRIMTAGPASARNPGSPDSTPLTAGSLLSALRGNPGHSWHPEEGAFESTGLDEKLGRLEAPELLKMLADLDDSPAGAGIRSRARFLLIAKFLAAKDPAAAMGKAVQFKMPDEAFLNIARSWCGKPEAGGVEALQKMLEQADTLPAGKFGSDPPAAVRKGMAAGLAIRNQSAAVELCRAAAGMAGAADYLSGLAYSLAKDNRRETMFSLLEGVPAGEKAAPLADLAMYLGRYQNMSTLKDFLNDPAFPQDLRRRTLLDSIIKAPPMEMNRQAAADLETIAECSAPQDADQTTLDWLRAVPPTLPGWQGGDDPETRTAKAAREDARLENALRLAAATDPALAQRWLQAFKDPGRRDAFAREFNLSKP
ncbi:MAG: sigma-70 family RNA polymerase sigma factor [Verrucomicrobiota bacterium]